MESEDGIPERHGVVFAPGGDDQDVTSTDLKLEELERRVSALESIEAIAPESSEMRSQDKVKIEVLQNENRELFDVLRWIYAVVECPKGRLVDVVKDGIRSLKLSNSSLERQVDKLDDRVFYLLGEASRLEDDLGDAKRRRDASRK